MKKTFLIIFLLSLPFTGYAQVIYTELPDEIIELEEKYPFIKPATRLLNKVQNAVIPTLQEQKVYAIEKKEHYDVMINPLDDGIDPLHPMKEKNEPMFWLFTIYLWIILFGIWIFTTALGLGLFVLLVIYLVVKILIKLFGPQARIIS